jgi:hypothetical protein
MPDFLLSLVFLILHPSKPPVTSDTLVRSRFIRILWLSEMKSVTWQFIHPHVGRVILDLFNDDFRLRRLCTMEWRVWK